MSKKRSKTQNPILEKVIKVLIASAVGIVLTVCLLLLSSVLVLRNDLPESIQTVFAFFSCLVSSFLAGFIAGKALQKSGIVYGTVSTLPICLFLMILCAAFYGSVGGKYALCSLLMLVFGAIGGICAVNLRPKRRYR